MREIRHSTGGIFREMGRYIYYKPHQIHEADRYIRPHSQGTEVRDGERLCKNHSQAPPEEF